VVTNSQPDRLVESTPDVVSLCMAVEERFLDLANMYGRMKGEEIPIPSSLDNAMFRWRKMVIRYKSGDFRNTQAEFLSVKELAEWTVRMKQELCDQQVTNWQLGDEVGQ